MTDMLVKLYDLPEIAPSLTKLKEQGFVIRPAAACERHSVVNWVQHTFTEGWASECEIAFGSHPICCHIALTACKIIGFACFESTSRGFFGPIGVEEAWRKHTVGKNLLLSCLHAMAAIGYTYGIIGDVGPTRFFSKVSGATEIAGSSFRINRYQPS
jgi:hypothetical protein